MKALLVRQASDYFCSQRFNILNSNVFGGSNPGLCLKLSDRFVEYKPASNLRPLTIPAASGRIARPSLLATATCVWHKVTCRAHGRTRQCRLPPIAPFRHELVLLRRREAGWPHLRGRLVASSPERSH